MQRNATMRIKKNLDVIIIEKLKDEIIAGKWRQGQELLIDELAEHFGVSRTPVIQAARMMAVEGMFHFKSNGRIEIPHFESPQVIDIYETRFMLEDFALRTICRRHAPLDKALLDAIAKECAAQQNILYDAVAARRADLRLHRTLVASTRNECLLSSYDRVQGQYMVANYLLMSHSEKLQSKAGEDHFVLLDHLYGYDYAAARDVLEAHIMEGCRRVVAKIDETAHPEADDA